MKENQKTIEKSVVRIDRIVVELMDTVAIEQGRLALDLAPVRLGYRAKYICAAARQVASGAVDLEAVRHMDYAHAKAELLRLTGVGIKVAECICLFALHHIDAFPVDTHIRQMLDAHYPKGFPLKRYKGFAGVMQQYAFYYELSLKG